MFSYFRGSPVPKCDLEMDHPKNGLTECIVENGKPPNDTYLLFTQQLEEYVGADCWAVMVNGKLLFNNYENRSTRDKILDDCVRDKVMNNIHKSVLFNFFREKKNATMTIYMFGQNAYTLNVNFEANYSETESKFTITFKKSQNYVDHFENESNHIDSDNLESDNSK